MFSNIERMCQWDSSVGCVEFNSCQYVYCYSIQNWLVFDRNDFIRLDFALYERLFITFIFINFPAGMQWFNSGYYVRNAFRDLIVMHQKYESYGNKCNSLLPKRLWLCIANLCFSWLTKCVWMLGFVFYKWVVPRLLKDNVEIVSSDYMTSSVDMLGYLDFYWHHADIVCVLWQQTSNLQCVIWKTPAKTLLHNDLIALIDITDTEI